ncbi:MAG: hypothetical protein ACPL5F_01455 [Moorellaceae bacterium]
MFLKRSQKREIARQLTKEAMELIISHDRQIIECGFWLDVVITALKDAGMLDDEKIEAAKKKVLEKLQEAQKAVATGRQEEQ